MKTIPISIALTAEELAELERMRSAPDGSILASKSRCIGYLILHWSKPPVGYLGGARFAQDQEGDK